MNSVDIYTDGACKNNPGPGGWAAVILVDKQWAYDVYGSIEDTTNQRMELTACIEGLNVAPEGYSHIRIYSDSAYIINAMNDGWIERWQKRNWTTAARKTVSNIDLWAELLEEEAKRDVVEWIKVKGHANNSYNNQADALASQAARQQITSIASIS